MTDFKRLSIRLDLQIWFDKEGTPQCTSKDLSAAWWPVEDWRKKNPNHARVELCERWLQAVDKPVETNVQEERPAAKFLLYKNGNYEIRFRLKAGDLASLKPNLFYRRKELNIAVEERIFDVRGYPTLRLKPRLKIARHLLEIPTIG
jgi:hypothetical protein